MRSVVGVIACWRVSDINPPGTSGPHLGGVQSPRAQAWLTNLQKLARSHADARAGLLFCAADLNRALGEVAAENTDAKLDARRTPAPILAMRHRCIVDTTIRNLASGSRHPARPMILNTLAETGGWPLCGGAGESQWLRGLRRVQELLELFKVLPSPSPLSPEAAAC